MQWVLIGQIGRINMKKGFYKSSKVNVEDNYGGVVFEKDSYYILVYSDECNIYFYLSTSGNPRWTIFEKSVAMKKVKGRVFKNENELKFVLYNPNLDTNLILVGKDNGKSMSLRGYYENTPDKVWLDDVFEYIGFGEGID